MIVPSPYFLASVASVVSSAFVFPSDGIPFLLDPRCSDTCLSLLHSQPPRKSCLSRACAFCHRDTEAQRDASQSKSLSPLAKIDSRSSGVADPRLQLPGQCEA